MRYKKNSTIIFLILAIPMVMQANAQISEIPDTYTEVRGKYSNPSTGVEIVFPDDWSGFEMSMPGSTIVMVMPGGPEAQAEDVITIISLNIRDKKPEEKTPPPIRPPIERDIECKMLSTTNVKISGATAIETIIECYGEGISLKTKAYTIESKQRWINVMYTTVPISDYDKHVKEFDESVKTLKVSNIIDIKTDVPGGEEENIVIVEYRGDRFEVPVNMTNGTVKDIRVDEDFKSIIVMVETENEDGKLMITLPRILIDSTTDGKDDKFMVTIDDNIADYIEISTTKEERQLEIEIPGGTSKIEIAGSWVIPEFPVAVIALAGVIIATAIVIGKLKPVAQYIFTF